MSSTPPTRTPHGPEEPAMHPCPVPTPATHRPGCPAPAWLVAAALCLAAAGPAAAQYQHGPTAAEMRELPDYCRAKLGGEPEQHDAWRTRMGPDTWLHVHHFCHGINYTRRALASPESQKRRERLLIAINEFDYVLQRWPAELPIAQEARRRRGFAQSLLPQR